MGKLAITMWKLGNITIPRVTRYVNEPNAMATTLPVITISITMTWYTVL